MNIDDLFKKAQEITTNNPNEKIKFKATSIKKKKHRDENFTFEIVHAFWEFLKHDGLGGVTPKETLKERYGKNTQYKFVRGENVGNIKIRMWNMINEKMYSMMDMQIAGVDLFTLLDDSSFMKVMQYSGLKDKNGTEICVGDIAEDEYEGVVGHIVKDEGNTYFTFDNVLILLSECHMDLIVVGNIYEDKELLEVNAS